MCKNLFHSHNHFYLFPFRFIFKDIVLLSFFFLFRHAIDPSGELISEHVCVCRMVRSNFRVLVISRCMYLNCLLGKGGVIDDSTFFKSTFGDQFIVVVSTFAELTD